MFEALTHLDEICTNVFKYLSFYELSNSIYFVSKHFYELTNTSNILFANLCDGEMNLKGIVEELNPYRSEIEKLLWPEPMQHFCLWKKIFILLNSKSDIHVYMSDIFSAKKLVGYLYKVYSLYFNEECMKVLNENKESFIQKIRDFRVLGKIRLFQTEVLQSVDAKLDQYITNHKATLRMNLYWSTLLPNNTIHSKLLDQIINSEERNFNSQLFKSISELQEFKLHWDKERVLIEEDAQRRSRYQTVTLPMFRVWLYNDESHSFDQVVSTLRSATRKTFEECDSITWMAHSDEQSICFESEDFDRAMEVAKELEQVKLGYHVEKITKKYHFATNLLHLLEKIYKILPIVEHSRGESKNKEEQYCLILHLTRGKSLSDLELDFSKIQELRTADARFVFFMIHVRQGVVLFQSTNKTKVEQLFQQLDSKLYNVTITTLEEIKAETVEEDEEEEDEEEEDEEEEEDGEMFDRLMEAVRQ